MADQETKSELRPLTEIEQEFICKMIERLPPFIARREVRWLTGGVLRRQTLSNADSAGQGPEESYKVGTMVVYPTEALFAWMARKYGISLLQRMTVHHPMRD